MSTVVYAKYNFVEYKSSGEVKKYYDKENVFALYIFKSGWEHLHHCILESGDFETVDYYTYTSEQIHKTFGIKSFSRKEKLNKINASTL